MSELALQTLSSEAHREVVKALAPNSLAAQGLSLPPARLEGAAGTVVPARPLRSVPPIGNPDLIPGLSPYLRPQSAFQWWTLPYLSAITPQYVQQILIGGLAGNHVPAWQLFDLMIDTNPEIASCVGEYIDGIVSKKIIIEPYHDEDSPPSAKAQRNQKIISAAFRNMLPLPEADENGIAGTIRDIAFAAFHGQSVLETDFYEADDPNKLHTLNVSGIGRIIAPRCTFWVHPVCYAWDATGRMGLRVPAEDLRGIGQQSKGWKPGNLPSDFGWTSGLTWSGYSGANRAASLTPFPRNQFLISIIKAKTGSMLGGSRLRPLAGWWVFENFSADFAMDLAQIFGLPFRVAYYDSNTLEPEKAFVRDMLENMGSRGWALLPSSVKLEFQKTMESGTNSPQAFLINLCHEQYRKVILRQTMTGAGRGAASGSKAGMAAEQDVKAICIQMGADYAANVLREQFARAILRLNVGDDAELPFIRLSQEEEGSLEDMQRDVLGASVVDVGENYFRTKYNYPRPAPGEKLAEKSNPSPSGNQPDGQPGQPGGGKGPKVSGHGQPGGDIGRDGLPGASQTMNASTLAKEATPPPVADLKAIGHAISDKLSPLLNYLRQGLNIEDPAAQQAFFRRALAQWPQLTAPLQHDPSVSETILPELVQGFVEGMQSRSPSRSTESKP